MLMNHLSGLRIRFVNMKTDKMKRTLASLSGISWLVNDIFWYWGYTKTAFVICCFTVLFMGSYFINLRRNPSSIYLVCILNLWVWMSMCSLIKEAFKLSSTTIMVIDGFAMMFTFLSIALVFRLLRNKEAVLTQLRRI